MEHLWIILSSILTSTSLSLILPWIYGHTKREDADDSSITRTKYPKRYMVCAIIGLIFAISFAATIIILLITYGEGLHFAGWIAFSFCMLFFISIPLLLILLGLRTYEIIQQNGILVKRLTKTKFVSYSEMRYYTKSYNQISIYDYADKLIFYVADNRVGIQALMNQLIAHNIPKK